MAKKKIKRKYKSKYKKYATAGMYNDNTIQASGQQSAGQTANIVFQESNPQVLQQKMDFLKQTKEDLQRSSETTANEIAQQEQLDKQSVAAAQQEVEQKFEAGENLAMQGKQAFDKYQQAAGFIAQQKAKKLAAEKAAQSIAGEGFGNLARKKGAEEVSKILSSQTAQKGAELSLSGTTGGSSSLLSSFGSSTVPQAVTPGITSAGTTLGTEAAKTAGTELAKTAGTEAVKTVGTEAAKQGAGSALKSFATSGAGIGTIASIAGTGIKMLSDDNDPTKSNFGEYSGSILQSAGTGATIGSFLGPVGTAVGAGIGAIYGAGKQFFGTRKAKREQAKLDRERRRKIAKHNKEVKEQVASATAQARAGELEQKTYSGYDLGRNVGVAKMGGMRMGTPRYGFRLA